MINKERRRNYYINREFQGKFILKFCLLVVLGSFISGAIIYYMSQSAVMTTFENSKLVVKSAKDFILPAVLLSSVIVIMAIGIATVIITLFTSHKIAGPLYRIEKDIDEITAGRLNIVINLRHGDEIKPIAASLNDMIRSIRERVVSIKQDLFQLENEINKMQGQVPENIKDAIKRAKETLDRFNV